MGKKEEISAAITPALSDLGFYLEDITITSAKAIGEIVENIQSLGQAPFTLEVTSPGLDRPLTKPRHWRKNIDRLVKIVLLDGKEIKGRVKDVSEISTTVDDQVVKFSEIKRATLEIEFKQVGK